MALNTRRVSIKDIVQVNQEGKIRRKLGALKEAHVPSLHFSTGPTRLFIKLGILCPRLGAE